MKKELAGINGKLRALQAEKGALQKEIDELRLVNQRLETERDQRQQTLVQVMQLMLQLFPAQAAGTAPPIVPLSSITDPADPSDSNRG
jgi:septal ring factor EnvC (AmiA/AmiB activator)